MKPIEPLPNIWASDIHVASDADFLYVRGSLPYISEGGATNRDLFGGYLDWARHCEKRGGLRSPHIQFANAVTDEKLVEFVRIFGPVAAILVEESVADASETINALQTLESLRRERQVYAAALGLLTELEKEKSTYETERIQRCIDQICDGCEHWPKEWQNEADWRKSNGHLPPNWRFSSRELENLHRLQWSATACPNPKGSEVIIHSGVVYCGHCVMCSLANTFIPEVQYAGVAYEAPAWDSRLFGVRPVLYYILRQEYVRRGGIRLCANVLCNKFFSLERGGQNFCTEECSRKQRQREYWSLRGATLRRERLAKRGRTWKNKRGKQGPTRGHKSRAVPVR